MVDEAGVLKIMAEKRCKVVKLDYFPPRPAMMIPRDESDMQVEPYPLNPIALTFTLEDAMFGGVCYVALCCGHRVVVNPFVWSNYDALTKISLKPAR